jgi:hypothetical protein
MANAGSAPAAMSHGDPELEPAEPGGVALHCTGKPQQNAFAESFIGRLRDECLNKTLFTSPRCGRHTPCWRIGSAT